MSPSADVFTFTMDGDVVLFAQHRGDLYLLNETAGLIWQGFADGLPIDEIAELLATLSGRDQGEIQRDCEAVLEQWRQAGLIAHAGTATVTPARSSTTRWWGERIGDATAEPAATATIERKYRLADFSFLLRTQSDAEAVAVHDFVAHLADEAPSSPRWVLQVSAADGKRRLTCNGATVDASEPGGLLPMLHGHLVIAAYRTSACLVGLHSAAVTKNDRCILLAALPGSGKSTLTAALLGNGFKYMSDDTVLLTPPPVRVRGVMVRVGLKEGSWPVLAAMWPELETLPSYRRADGRVLRYWRPPDELLDRDHREGRAARALVFPRYDAGADATSVRELRRAEALVKLTEAGYDVPGAMTRDTVAHLIEWLGTIRCYDLTYSSTQEAIAVVTKLAE